MHSILSTSSAPVAPTPRHATAVGTQPQPAGRARPKLAGAWLLAAALSTALPTAQAAEHVEVQAT